MKKLSYIYVCYGVSLAIVLAVAVLPVSSWAFKNHLDILTGGWRDSGSMLGQWIQPVRLMGKSALLNTYKPNTVTTYPNSDLLSVFVEHAHQNPTDPAALAHVVRRNFTAPYSAGASDKVMWGTMNLKTVRQDALWAATQGTRVDPDNAFFWSEKAVLLDMFGEKQPAYDALKKAGQCHRFEEYGEREAAARYADMLTRAGYRGEKPPVLYWADVLLPHYASIKNYGVALRKRAQTKDTVQAQADILRVGELLQRTDPHLIGVIVASGVATDVLFPEDFKRTSISGNKDFRPRVAAFNALEKATGVELPYDPSPFTDRVMRIRGLVREDTMFHKDPMDSMFDWKSTTPAPISLLALCVSLLVAGLTFKIPPGSEYPRRLLPYIAAISAFWIATEYSAREILLQNGTPMFSGAMGLPDARWVAPVCTVAFIVLALMQFSKRWRGPATLAGVVACVGLVLWAYPVPYFYLPPIVFLGALILNRFSKPLPLALNAVLLFAFCAGVGLLVTQIALSGQDDTWIGYMLAASLTTCAVFFARGSTRLLRVAPVVTLLMSVAYLGAVAVEIRQNQKIKVAMESWSHEADLVRAEAGVR